MANSLMGLFGNGNLMMQAIGAMMRGESPQQFMRNLASTRPELQGLDLTDINAAAQKVCRERGVDPARLEAEIRQSVPGMK